MLQKHRRAECGETKDGLVVGGSSREMPVYAPSTMYKSWIGWPSCQNALQPVFRKIEGAFGEAMSLGEERANNQIFQDARVQMSYRMLTNTTKSINNVATALISTLPVYDRGGNLYIASSLLSPQSMHLQFCCIGR